MNCVTNQLESACILFTVRKRIVLLALHLQG